MKQWVPVVILIGFAIAIAFLSSGLLGGGLRTGETVTPILVRSDHWRPGDTALLAVRLQATSEDPASRRSLDFNAVSWKVDPIATIHFYHGDQDLESIAVPLNHRC